MKKFMIGVLLVLTFAAVGIAAAPPLTFTFTDVIANKSALETDSYGINNAGTITGDYIDKHAIQHGMVLAGKKLTSFDYKKCAGGGITAYSINKAGAVAGSCLNKNGVYIGFTWDGAKFTDINFPKGIGTQVNGINDRGDVAGQYFDAKGVQHAFVKLVGGKFTSFDWKGHTGAAADGINNQGQIAGYAVNKSGGYEGFLKSGKTFKSMNNPNAGSTGTIVNNLNNKGDLVGTYFDANNFRVGFLYHDKKYFDVVDPNASNSTRADGINDKLVIVGRYSPADSSNHGFKAVTKQ